MPKKNTPIDLLKVRDAVVAHWLRTGSGPDVTELARLLDNLECDLFLNHAGPGEPLRFSGRVKWILNPEGE